MNYADKMEQEARLMGRLASWMEQHGQILYDRQQSNIDVDGMTCRIERQ